MNISKSDKKVTNEVNIQKKTPVGSGAYHTVFPFEKFKDKIIKTKSKNISLNPDGSYNVVKDQGEPLDQDEMKIFQANPDLFAKVYKVTDRYAVIERLETKQMLRDVDKYIGNAIVRMIIRNPVLGKRLTTKKPNDLTGQDFDGVAIMNLFRNDRGIIKGILKNTSNKDFVIKMMQFINKCYNSISKKTSDIDIQERNIGYDKEGNIKLLDF